MDNPPGKSLALPYSHRANSVTDSLRSAFRIYRSPLDSPRRRDPIQWHRCSLHPPRKETMNQIDLAGLAALITAIVAIPGAIAAVHSRRAGTTLEEIRGEFHPDHGNSLTDKIDSLAGQTSMQTKLIDSLGHQIGEIRRDMAREHEHLARTGERHDNEITRLTSEIGDLKVKLLP